MTIYILLSYFFILFTSIYCFFSFFIQSHENKRKTIFIFFNCFTCHDKFLCHKYAFDKKKKNSFKIT